MSDPDAENPNEPQTSRGGYKRNSRPFYSRGRYFHGRHNRNVSRNKNETQNSQHQSNEGVVIDANPSDGPYVGWKLYLTDETHEKNNITENKLKLIETYITQNKDLFVLENIKKKCFFTVDVKNVSSSDNFVSSWTDFASDLKNYPEKIIGYFGLAMHQLIINESQQLLQNSCGTDSPPIIHARFINFEPMTQLKNLKANAYGKFVSVKGTVVRVSNIKPICTKMAFKCNNCSSIHVVLQPLGKYTTPSRCPVKSCYSHTFIPLRGSPLTETVDWQCIRLQETTTDEERESGRVPRIVECELLDDLVDSCIPGDIVTLSGTVKVNNSSDEKWSSNKDKSMFLLYILANSVASLRQSSQSPYTTPTGIEFGMKDLYAVQAIEAEKNLFRLIVASLCPSIYGHEVVKAGLVLGLFGGSHRFLEDSDHIAIRGDPHVLIVGDPGLGKSQMLQACSNIAPRGVYVCGNTTTSSGLTVTLVKEAGEYALEAGALVLADQGCCCIDEFDKMSNQHHALLEAMEQQTISIAKGGIVCSLPARTSILAAANPVGGHYNKAKTVSENLKLGSALLSRFDLVFIILDKPDEELDIKLSEHVIALHSKKRDLTQPPLKKLMCNSNSPQCSASSSLLENKISVKEKLKFKSDEECDPIPPQLLRKYIAYARKYVHPALSSEAAAVLQKFYLDLRKHHKSQDSTPITTRQLESLIRLTEARARLELRELCTSDDAQDVVDIMKYSMVDTYSDQFGMLDFQRSAHGSGMSSRSLPKKFINALTRVAERTNNNFYTVQNMKQIAKDVNIEIVGFEEFITALNNQGFLLKKGPKLYQLQTYE